MADGRYQMSKSKYRGGMSRSMRDDDFTEDEVWGFVHEGKDSSPKLRSSSKGSSSFSASGSSSAWQLPNNTSPRMIPRASNNLSHETKLVHHQSSAPLNIPDWSGIYGKVKVKNPKKDNNFGSWEDNDGIDGNEFVPDGKNYGNNNQVEEEEEEEEGEEMIPPHEWIARKLARSQISSFSVFEGVGRTLKGRDLSRVRNAVLTKTGFLE